MPLCKDSQMMANYNNYQNRLQVISGILTRTFNRCYNTSVIKLKPISD